MNREGQHNDYEVPTPHPAPEIESSEGYQNSTNSDNALEKMEELSRAAEKVLRTPVTEDELIGLLEKFPEAESHALVQNAFSSWKADKIKEEGDNPHAQQNVMILLSKIYHKAGMKEKSQEIIEKAEKESLEIDTTRTAEREYLLKLFKDASSIEDSENKKESTDDKDDDVALAA
jgi:hypothetical protein